MHTQILLFSNLMSDGSPYASLCKFGQEAYEHYMLAPYMRELLMVRNDPGYICWSPHFETLHTTLRKLGPVQFEELGSTLFSTIDKFDKLGEHDIQYVGIEIAPLLIDVAVTMHPSTKLEHHPRWQDIPDTDRPIVSRSYQSTSYAFHTTNELFDWISRSIYGIHGIHGIHGIRWSIDSKISLTTAGNDHTLFDPDEFAALADAQDMKISVIKSEIQTYGRERFSISWISTSRSYDIEVIDPVCELSREALNAQPIAGPNNEWIFHGNGRRPFDFEHPELMLRLQESV